MDLVILHLSSPDVVPNVAGFPTDTEYFDLAVEVMLAPKGKEGDDVSFTFSVISQSALQCRPDIGFIAHTLVLSEFSWDEIRRHIDRLIMQAKSCNSWACVAFRFAPFMRAFGVTFNAL